MPRPMKLYFPTELHREFEQSLTAKVTHSHIAGYFPDYIQEAFEVFLLRKGYGLVRNKCRAQKLSKRGEPMRCSEHLNGWIWIRTSAQVR